MSEVEHVMDEREAELRKQEVDALNRWVEIDKRYRDALPPVSAVAPGQEPPSFVPNEQYLLEMEALEKERESVRKEYEEAREALRVYRARQRA